MLKKNHWRWVLAIGLCASMSALSARAQSDGDVDEAKISVEEMWPTSGILDTAVKNLARRYNLNEEQAAYTNEMMTKRVNRFITEHRAEVWPLLRDLIMLQRDGSMPDAETAQRLGPVAMKILRDAKEEIYRSNEEWRNILTDDQKRVHDWDLREMDKTFEVMETNFQNWEEGKVSAEPIFPTQDRTKKPPRPRKPESAGTYHPSPEDDPERDDQFDIYVKKFIKDWDLKPDQIEAAQSILREIKNRAASFRQNNADQIAEVKRKLLNPSVDQRQVWDKKRKELMKPIRDLFVEMKTRLDQIPDDAQRERYEQRAEKDRRGERAVSSTKRERPRQIKGESTRGGGSDG